MKYSEFIGFLIELYKSILDKTNLPITVRDSSMTWNATINNLGTQAKSGFNDIESTHGDVKRETKIICFLKEYQLELLEGRRPKDWANKEIFWCEFNPNSMDTLDKIHYELITYPEKTETQPNFFIEIIPDKIDLMITIQGFIASGVEKLEKMVKAVLDFKFF
mmetsp:Transcript_3878/g.10436  ORF Transcript_3878/g.10436 Transcript_3878/m.10436 type:complete len:163 (+) Transcript_3878:180-668(+)